MEQLSLELHSSAFSYQLTRSRRKTLVIYVKSGKVDVRAPLKAPQKWVNEFITEKTPWILRQLADQQRRLQQRLVLADGTRFTLAGQPLTLHIALSSRPRAVCHGTTLTLYVKERRRDRIEKLFLDWLQQQAADYMPPKVREYARKLGVEQRFSKVTWRKTRTKWGHCDEDGVIQFNWLLMLAPRDVLDYLIAHETSHLRYLNHSTRFWRTVESVCPDYKQHREWLTRNGHSLWPAT